MLIRAMFLAALVGTLSSFATGCGSEDERPPTFTYLYETVLGPSCATIGCHSDFVHTFGFRFSTKAGMYAILTGRACTDHELEDEAGEAQRNYVFPGDPSRSALIPLLYGDDVPLRMPPDRGLSVTDIRLVEDWILEGAKCD